MGSHRRPIRQPGCAGALAVPDAGDLGTQLPGGCGAGDREADTCPPEEIACWEAGLLAVARCWFAGIRPGDDAAIRHSHRKDIKEALIG